jgi:pimeloyl-ACP methyl ester carboxylesterase
MAAIASQPKLNIVEAGAGPDFVFQHGLLGDAAQPAEMFPAEAPFRMLTVECRGHGKSEAGDADAFSIATFADDVAGAIEARGSASRIVGGISMGAAIALRLAIIRPDLVSALVIARPAWMTDAAPPNMRGYAEVGELLARFPPAEARERFELSDTAARLRMEGPENLASLRSFFARGPTAETSALLTRIAADGPGVTASDISALRLPTLVIGQSRDPLHPLFYAEELARMIPGARFEKVTSKAESRQAHVTEFRAALRRFLTSLAQQHG